METPKYVPQNIESNWQKRWEDDGIYRAAVDHNKEKFYCLTMLPYPSGDLHIGHWYAMTPSDARARYMRMKGFNVMFPIGFDAFGLPAENAAIKNNVHPKEWTYKNIKNMRKQLRTMGAMWDWEREAVTCDPEYYRWSQWFFLQMFKNDMVYRKKSPVDFCPVCNTTLAREQVWGEDRHCERCSTPVIKKDLEQWFYKITDYCEELLDYSSIDWPDRVQLLQKNWIGKSQGAHVKFKINNSEEIEVFTTRPDTLWGATFMVLAPEHDLVSSLTTDDQRSEVNKYIEKAIRQTDVERESVNRIKTGVFTGGYAINPVNDDKIPVWVADYVLMTYGTGAIMAVPAHDQRDFEFASKYGIEIKPVIKPIDDNGLFDGETIDSPILDLGQMINSGPLTGTSADDAINTTINWLESNGKGQRAVNYRLHDWLISRQRYWGTPIPMVYCDQCGMQPVNEDQLPVLLPDEIEWKPTGESPLKYHPTWKNVDCPKCGDNAIRETDTMDTFMCSSWYQYRYLSPEYHDGPWDSNEFDYWMPVDTYTGGIEHATMHLIYFRYFTKVLRDLGMVNYDEPVVSLRNQGVILGEDSEKMSKSRGNVISPDHLVESYGADAVRAYLMFFARWEQGAPWSSTGIEGISRWLHRVWRLVLEFVEHKNKDDISISEVSEKALRDLTRKIHKTIQDVSNDMDKFQFNTVISSLMELTNTLNKAYTNSLSSNSEFMHGLETLLLLMAPIVPHISEELWLKLGNSYSVHNQSWPVVDREAVIEEEIVLVIQVNGKVRDRLLVDANIDADTAKSLAIKCDNVQKYLQGKDPKQIIYIPGRLVNVVL
ncbi:MAG TPA: leucine--tRNA ligase [Chloroflexi bacterium]|nr:leucine--tRNA ligase [Chloroflexota bacterium]